MKKSDFVHLHVHTEMSIQDAMIKPVNLAKKCKELGQTAIAITNHGYLYNAPGEWSILKKEGIKPILGLETYVAPRKNTDKEPHIDNANYHLVLLAENEQGWKNILQIASNAGKEGLYYRPRTDMDHLRQYSEGIIALSACIAGEVQQHILNDNYDIAKSTALEYDKIFGRGNYYLELQDHGMPEQATVNASLKRMSAETGIPLVATNDCHYIESEDATAHDVLMALQAKAKVTSKKRKIYPSKEFYVKSAEQMSALFPDVPEAIANTKIIADRCNVEIEFGKICLPPFPIPGEFKDEVDYIRKLAYDGAAERYDEITKEVSDRIEYEIDVINRMGFIGYFLIVWDKMRFCREGTLNAWDTPRTDWEPILTGPGRGSGAGSILAYCLKITHIEPLKYDLWFERFLDPSRISMPDFDLDYDDVRRLEILDFFKLKYGENSVCQILTFSIMKARSVIRDVGRALDYPNKFIDSIATQIPKEIGMTISKALEVNAPFRKMYESNSDVREIIDISLKLEGLPRHTSTHAAGVLVTGSEGVTSLLPVKYDKNGLVVTQYDKQVVEDIGGCKFDELGLKTLGMLNNALKNIKRNHGVSLSLEELYQGKDKRVFDIIKEGNTASVFQCEGAGMTDFLTKLAPDSISDLTAGISLYRPGPMQYIPQFLENKRDNSKINLLFSGLEPILRDTYGILTYQEQCMRAVVEIAGYHKSDSDSFRKVIGKKILKMLPMHRQWFIDGRGETYIDYQGYEAKSDHKIPGGVQLGHPREALEKFFDQMEEFGKYSFNKSHGACYAALAYVTAYFSYYYPTEFFAAVLDYAKGKNTKMLKYSATCQKRGIRLTPPDVNKSLLYFNPVSDGEIAYSMRIKNTSDAAVLGIVAEREKNGEFTSLSNFLARTANCVTAQVYMALAAVGAFKSFCNIPISVLIAMRNDLYGSSKLIPKIKEKMASGIPAREIESFVDDYLENKNLIPKLTEYPESVRLFLEKEYLGHYLTGHPLNRVRDMIDDLREKHGKNKTVTMSDFDYEIDEETGDISISDNIRDGSNVTFIGIIEDIIPRSTRNKDLMANIIIEDLTGSYDAVAFPQAYSFFGGYLKKGCIYMFNATVKCSDDRPPSLIINDVDEVDNSTRNRAVIEIFEQSQIVPIMNALKSSGATVGDVMATYIKIKNVLMLLDKERWVNRRAINFLNKSGANAYIQKW